jgi:predicted nucleic acid-binding protein
VIVADVSLLTRFAVRHDESDLADAVCAVDAVWAAPVLWRSEFREALAQLIRHGGLGLDSALLAWQAAEEIVGDREYRVASAAVLELAMRSRCTAYDCEYVALALDLGVPLVTADKHIARAFPKNAVLLEKFARKL